jgi:hypothetical protein
VTREERAHAYVDGELTSAERAAFEADMAADPLLAAQVEQQSKLAGRIAATYAPILAEPIPGRLHPRTSTADERLVWRVGLPQWAAMAASLLVGVVAARAFWPEQAALVIRGEHLEAQGDLARALNTQLASSDGPVRIGLSLRARDGRYCRTFESPRDKLAGLACHEGGRWVAEVTQTWNPAPKTAYRTAASAISPAVLAAVDAIISGATLDAAHERLARDSGWTATEP